MGSTSRSGRATINPAAPEALGICDGCGFLFNLRTLTWQMGWCGTTLKNLHLRKCSTCLDIPNEQLRTIILPPDPLPVSDPRLEQFAVDERNDYTLSKIVGKAAMFVGGCAIECELVSTKGIRAAIDGIGDLVAILTRGALLSASVDAVSDVSGALLKGLKVTAAIDGVSDVTAELTQAAGSLITLFGSSTADSSSTFDVPASVLAGDLIVVLDLSTHNSGSAPTTVVPTDFTSIVNTLAPDGDQRQILSYKLAVGTEGGTTLTGMEDDGVTVRACKCLYVFRRSPVAGSLTVAGVVSTSVNTNPAAQNITASSGVVPLVVIGGYGCFNSPISPRTFTPAKDGEIFGMIGSDDTMYLAYKIYNSSPANVSIDMDDEGSGNTLQGCYIQMGV